MPGSTNGKKSGRILVRSPSPNIASTNDWIAPRRSAMVSPSSTARHSIWWNTGLCVASSGSVRKHLPGLTTYTGSGRVSRARICTGEVCVRSTTPEWPPSGPATKIVSCISRAGWSGGKFSASKLYHSASTSGPSAISYPMPTNTSASRSPTVVTGCLAPAGCRSQGRVTSTVSSTSTRWSRSASSSACRASSACRTSRRAAPTRWPASALACGGSAPISALASASGDRSPAWASRAAFSSSSVRASGDGGERLLQRGGDLLGRQRRHLHRVVVLVGCGHKFRHPSRALLERYRLRPVWPAG